MKRLLSRFALSALLLCALLPVSALAAPPAQEGREYALIKDGAPWQPLKGQIEVAEVFAYWCGHCADFAPKLEAWKTKQPKNVRLSYIPLPSGPDDAFARGFFAAQAAGGQERTHAALFRAVHDSKTVPARPSVGELATWFGSRQLDSARMKTAMEAPALAERVTAARDFAVRSGVEGTPTLIINGRYRILGNSYEALLANADAVIAMLRTKR